jgi:hypothetical protein
MSVDDLDEFTLAYVTCALWSTHDNSDPETGGDPMDANYDPYDIAPETLAKMARDCRRFRDENPTMLGRAGDDQQNGHDFWLTRNGHGAGFWDRGYPGNTGTVLTKAAQGFGEVDLYVGDDGQIHAM